MRKSFAFLAGIFVCALVTTGGLAQSRATMPLDQRESAASGSNGAAVAEASSNGVVLLSGSQVEQMISAAKELLKSQPTLTNNLVRLATLDPQTSEMNLLSVPKESFLIKGANLLVATQLGHNVRVRVISANGVNTAVAVTDAATGRSFFPLVVEYPIVKRGALTETAYYTSAHPALLSPALTAAGETYVRTMLERAAERLALGGIKISPDIVDVAEHLCIVEHTDHKRFLTEDRAALFPEILSLYALNQENTFRYSVSSAGAGGMIQMIPRTYEGIRHQHPGLALQVDFVSGMRDHANALEAMLLYIDDTWKNLQQSTEVHYALHNGIATKAELLAAGYNSNPMRLPLYLKRGGADWRTLIPAETKMYLAIYGSLDSTIEFQKHKGEASDSSTTMQSEAAVGNRNPVSTSLASWLRNELMSISESLLSHTLG